MSACSGSGSACSGSSGLGGSSDSSCSSSIGCSRNSSSTSSRAKTDAHYFFAGLSLIGGFWAVVFLLSWIVSLVINTGHPAPPQPVQSPQPANTLVHPR